MGTPFTQGNFYHLLRIVAPTIYTTHDRASFNIPANSGLNPTHQRNTYIIAYTNIQHCILQEDYFLQCFPEQHLK